MWHRIVAAWWALPTNRFRIECGKCKWRFDVWSPHVDSNEVKCSACGLICDGTEMLHRQFDEGKPQQIEILAPCLDKGPYSAATNPASAPTAASAGS